MNAGDEWTVESPAITITQLVQYAGASGDFATVHHDAAAARDLGYPGVFAHGMLTMAIAGQALSNHVGVDAVHAFGARFTHPVWVGDRLCTTIRVVDVSDTRARLAITTHTQDGVLVLDATAVVDALAASSSPGLPDAR